MSYTPKLPATLILAAAALCPAQTLTFEAASVKPAASSDRRAFSIRGGPGTATPGHLYLTSANLSGLIMRAYEAKLYAFSYPPWMDDARYDITAKIPEGASKQEANAMLRNLLAERFHVEVHRETRVVPVYHLQVAKGGPKVAPVPEDDRTDGVSVANRANRNDGFPEVTPEMLSGGLLRLFTGGKARLILDKQPMERFAGVLWLSAGRPVLDRTGLSGQFRFILNWTPDDAAGQPGSGPSFFSALQDQLGLRLEPAKAPIERLIVDRADKTPAEN